MPAPLRLALVITELEPGGAERCLVNLATRLDKQEFAPVVYSLRPRPPASKDLLVRQLAEAGVPAQFLDLTRQTQYFSAIRHLARLLAEQQAEVVQTFLFHANVVGAQAARRAGVPFVCTGIRVADPRRWRTTVERFATSKADRFVCVSQSVADFCRARGFAEEKLVVIPNGIDVNRWKTAIPADLMEFGLPAGARAIVFAGRLDEQKGLDDLVGALPAVLKQVANAHLLLVGDGPRRFALHELAAKLGVAERVHFAGWQSEMPPIFAAAELVVLPSRWEGMPNVVLEGMAAGLPVMATRAEGVEELLGDAASEQVVPIGDRHGLADRICHILAHPALAKDLGKCNSTRASLHFGLDRMISRFAELYRSQSCTAAKK